jgi:hypothetical protein
MTTCKIYTQTANIIAAAITNVDDLKVKAAIADVARQLAEMFKRDNSAFRYDRFFPACRLDMLGELTTIDNRGKR